MKDPIPSFTLYKLTPPCQISAHATENRKTWWQNSFCFHCPQTSLNKMHMIKSIFKNMASKGIVKIEMVLVRDRQSQLQILFKIKQSFD